MATLLIHKDEIVAEFKAAFSDKVLTIRETGTLASVIVRACKDVYEKLTDKSQFSALVNEGEVLYDWLVDAKNFDIPHVPEPGEQLAVLFGRSLIRPGLQLVASVLDGARQP